MMYGGSMMILGWLAILVVVVFAAKILLGNSRGENSQSRVDQGQRALDILNQRYAQGELSESEYLAMKANLLK